MPITLSCIPPSAASETSFHGMWEQLHPFFREVSDLLEIPIIIAMPASMNLAYKELTGYAPTKDYTETHGLSTSKGILLNQEKQSIATQYEELTHEFVFQLKPKYEVEFTKQKIWRKAVDRELDFRMLEGSAIAAYTEDYVKEMEPRVSEKGNTAYRLMRQEQTKNYDGDHYDEALPDLMLQERALNHLMKTDGNLMRLHQYEDKLRITEGTTIAEVMRSAHPATWAMYYGPQPGHKLVLLDHGAFREAREDMFQPGSNRYQDRHWLRGVRVDELTFREYLRLGIKEKLGRDDLMLPEHAQPAKGPDGLMTQRINDIWDKPAPLPRWY